MADNAKKDQAQQKTAQRAADGRQAMAEYEAEAAAVRAKTERLRAQRLAREAAESATGPAKPAATKGSAPKKKSGKSAKGASSTLSQWLQDQHKGGRRT